VNLERIILAAVRSPIGSLIIMAVILYLLTILLGLCGCVSPRECGADTRQRWDVREGHNFGTF